jgi:ribosomal protein S18 acetylase RimI-like enzyme
MNTIVITPFDNAVHRGQVVAMWEAVFGYEAAHNRPGLVIDKKIEVGDQLFFVALIDGAIVGSVMAGYDGHRGWIYSLAVDPSHRRQGIGSRLVSRAEGALTGKGSVKINLQIMEGNERVTAFYSSLGYSVEKRVSMGKRIPKNVTTA